MGAGAQASPLLTSMNDKIPWNKKQTNKKNKKNIHVTKGEQKGRAKKRTRSKKEKGA